MRNTQSWPGRGEGNSKRSACPSHVTERAHSHPRRGCTGRRSCSPRGHLQSRRLGMHQWLQLLLKMAKMQEILGGSTPGCPTCVTQHRYTTSCLQGTCTWSQLCPLSGTRDTQAEGERGCVGPQKVNPTQIPSRTGALVHLFLHSQRQKHFLSALVWSRRVGSSQKPQEGTTAPEPTCGWSPCLHSHTSQQTQSGSTTHDASESLSNPFVPRSLKAEAGG